MLLGHPVLGDPQHRTQPPLPPPRLALHAAVLGFLHPRTGDGVDLLAPLPDDLAGWLARLRARQA
jgi:23S rRNA pseudouridine1911/1915/1917 synthase